MTGGVAGAWRHLDVYLTMAVSLVLGVLGMLNVVNSAMLAGATLAMLGLVGAASLGGRLQVTSLGEATAELANLVRERPEAAVSVDRLLSVSTSGTGADLPGAVDIRILGVTLCRTLRNTVLTLRSRLDDGATVRIALLEPSPDALQEAARRSTVPGSPELFQHRLQPTIDLLRQLAADAPAGRFQVRLLSFVPAFGLIITDPSEAHGRVDVDIYSHRLAVGEPTLTLLADRDRRWYPHFLQEFERIWSTGRPLDTDGVEVR
jgi:hypothetical protein